MTAAPRFRSAHESDAFKQDDARFHVCVVCSGNICRSPIAEQVLRAEIDHAGLFAVNREATVRVIKKALANEPKIDWLLKNQDKVTHYFHQLGLDGKV